MVLATCLPCGCRSASIRAGDPLPVARIFISHASANRQQAERLQVDLSQMGHPDGFLDVENLRVGDDWEQRL